MLVTGASGLLGGRVAQALAARGDEVTVLQRGPSGLGLREVRADVADREAVRAAVAGQEAVIHLAAKVDVVGRWTDYVRVNVVGTTHVVAACRETGVERLVHVSTPSVAHAGDSLVGVAAGPADARAARGSYARSKAIAERIALAADDPEGRRTCVLVVRPHLVWGPGDTQLVERIVHRARVGRLPVIGTGAALVDSTYLDNAVDALVAALDHSPEVHGEALVISNGEPRPVAELMGGICRAAGVDLPTRHVAVAPARVAGTVVQGVWGLPGVRRWTAGRPPPLTRFLVDQLSTAHWFDQRRTREVLEWEPRVSLDAGLVALAASYAVAQPGPVPNLTCG
ncbi:MAG: NAD-dependent epimerase/dehydratase family protein [Propionibacteriaceae bacterium]